MQEPKELITILLINNSSSDDNNNRHRNRDSNERVLVLRGRRRLLLLLLLPPPIIIIIIMIKVIIVGTTITTIVCKHIITTKTNINNCSIITEPIIIGSQSSPGPKHPQIASPKQALRPRVLHRNTLDDTKLSTQGHFICSLYPGFRVLEGW